MNPRSKALRSFCKSAIVTQVIDKPTRVTESSALLDAILVSNPRPVKLSWVMDLTIRIDDRFPVYVLLANTYFTLHSFKKYSFEKFANRSFIFSR